MFTTFREKCKPYSFWGIVTVLIFGISLSASARNSIQEQISELIVTRCLECHGGLKEGELDLRTRQGALDGGETGSALNLDKPNKSLLIEQVYNEKMPPKHPLSDDEVELLEEWVKDGAPYPETPLDLFAYSTEQRGGYDWWSLLPLHRPVPPATQEISSAWQHWNENPIDKFVFATLSEKGLQPTLPALPKVLIRRATYDLIGLPPTQEEMNAFLAECETETESKSGVGDRAYKALIDRLLASPHYGEKWGRHWLDVVRFGESTGFEVNHIVDGLWPYRDYVIRSFNEDKPYNEFVREQIAGDAIGPGNVDIEVGMTFLVAGTHDIVGNQDPVQAAQIRANTVDEIIRTTSESFLGLTVGCARCHDHKFDAISQKDYYRFYSTFGGVYHDSRDVATEKQKLDYQEQLAPIEVHRDELNKEISALRDTIFERANSKRAEYEARWVRKPVDRTGTEEIFETVKARWVRIVAEGRDNDPYARTGYRLDEIEVWTDESVPRNVAASRNGGRASGSNTKPGDFADAYEPSLTIDEAYGASWIASAPTLTLQFGKRERISRVIFSSDRPGALSSTTNESTFLGEYYIEISTDGEKWIRVADSYDRKPVNDKHRRKRYLDFETTDSEREKLDELNRQLSDVKRERSKISALPRLYVGRLDKPKEPFHVFLGGDPQQKGERVYPSSIKILPEVTSSYEYDDGVSEQEGRLALANWIVDETNPITPRVAVNRLWHYHFGAGLVSTPSDFGFMGGRPSHPALLDWLASELIEPEFGMASGEESQAWRFKRLHKLIMYSATYRQAGTYKIKSAEVDANSRLLWRYPPRRLDAEEIRDTMLAISGKLDTRMGGPGFRLYRHLSDNVSTYIPLDIFGPKTYRRSVYHQNVRAGRVDLITDFDSPDCALPAPRRITTVSPLQALTLMNHQFTLDVARSIEELATANKTDDSNKNSIEKVFNIILAREPTLSELGSCNVLVANHGLDALCRILLNTNEFITVN